MVVRANWFTVRFTARHKVGRVRVRRLRYAARRGAKKRAASVSNENTNGLLRQYLPKGIDISSYSQAKLNAVARQLNERPRKTLGYQTPAEMFSHTVASTG